MRNFLILKDPDIFTPFVSDVLNMIQFRSFVVVVDQFFKFPVNQAAFYHNITELQEIKKQPPFQEMFLRRFDIR